MLDVEGLSLTHDERKILAEPEVGGLILFSRNYQDRIQLMSLVEDIRACNPEILIAVDQEGGRVQRFKEEFTCLPPLRKISELTTELPQHSKDIPFSLGWLMASEILSCGIDISFAPVLDLDEKSCKVISDRSFSNDPALCQTLASDYIRGMNEAGMAATAKHFPGHGAVREDSHLELPIDHRSLDQVMAQDLKPFISLSDVYQAVMPGHLLFPNVDEQPVGFSSYWLQHILRQKLQFDGVIFSDDLSMEGAASSGGYSRRAELALSAGCDMVLACNNPEGAQEVLCWLKRHPQPPCHRISRMHSHAKPDLNTIRTDPRYDRAQQYIAQINKLT